MDLLNRIENDLLKAQKERNEFQRDTLRYLKSSIKNASIAKKTDLTEDEIISVIQKEIKQRKDAAEQFTKANRPELVSKETEESTLLEQYLPSQLSDDELSKIISEVISEIGAIDKKDMGKVMNAVRPKVQGKAEGSRISQKVMEMLNHE